MNESGVVSEVANCTSLTKSKAEAAVNAGFEAVREPLARGEPVAVSGFGTFSVKGRSARTGRNPRTGESIDIADSKAPAFKAGKRLRDAVR